MDNFDFDKFTASNYKAQSNYLSSSKHYNNEAKLQNKQFTAMNNKGVYSNIGEGITKSVQESVDKHPPKIEFQSISANVTANIKSPNIDFTDVKKTYTSFEQDLILMFKRVQQYGKDYLSWLPGISSRTKFEKIFDYSQSNINADKAMKLANVESFIKSNSQLSSIVNKYMDKEEGYRDEGVIAQKLMSLGGAFASEEFSKSFVKELQNARFYSSEGRFNDSNNAILNLSTIMSKVSTK
jgi:hypothetical protein